MGYTGGATKHPTYYDLADHTETVEIDYDLGRTSYEELVEAFFAAHDAARSSSKKQYMSAIFVDGSEQERIARTVMQRVQERTKGSLKTQILPAAEFYLAEDYHQKYALQANRRLFQEFEAMYPDFWDIVDSPAASRTNAYLYGFGTGEQVAQEIDSLGLSEEGKQVLLRAAPAGACPVP